jgi:hypothetical protein
VREYLNSPPDLEGNHLTAGRDLYITFLQEAGAMANPDFGAAIDGLRQSQAAIPRLAEAIRQNDLDQAAACFLRIAEVEAEAHAALSQTVGVMGLPTAG